MEVNGMTCLICGSCTQKTSEVTIQSLHIVPGTQTMEIQILLSIPITSTVLPVESGQDIGNTPETKENPPRTDEWWIENLKHHSQLQKNWYNPRMNITNDFLF